MADSKVLHSGLELGLRRELYSVVAMGSEKGNMSVEQLAHVQGIMMAEMKALEMAQMKERPWVETLAFLSVVWKAAHLD